jgi:hypothetical protein
MPFVNLVENLMKKNWSVFQSGDAMNSSILPTLILNIDVFMFVGLYWLVPRGV